METPKGHIKRQRGFTLVELLVVIGILGVLTAIAVPAYFRFFGAGQTESAGAELANVQAAMDAMMADKKINVITASVAATNNFSALPTGTGADPLSPNYLRKNPTRCTYTWDTAGKVTQAVCP